MSAVRALVIYESWFGNTANIARAVWEGMCTRVPDTSVMEVGAAPVGLPGDLELLVVGGPTQAFGMSRASTRADARQWAGMADNGPTVGVREWLASLKPPARQVHAATFDTRIHSPHVPGSAAVGAWRALRRAGFDVAAEAESFWVLGTTGPLRDGELERARSWGVSITSLLPGPRPLDPGARSVAG
ncbi:flavodoxin family protein [Cellulomonas fengjieae]|uniref:flavodoxin family protein n=1 Tax=Cellulomonas fengjieae TaxID=2819978 RepID=UPI001AAF5217|nr:flavodoxin/nitric oxide synthase [Cellulomonas fengjieae]MBO3101207.1 flavodoxin/nitric oxide synthase [Cellulomonas fengjieae]